MNFDNKTLTHDLGQPLRTLPAKRKARQSFHGWWIVLASAFGLCWGIPISVYSFSMFFRPLMQEFHVGRAAVSLAFTLTLFAGALSATPAGWLIDRYGPRRVILIGTAIFGSILLANRFFSGSIARFYCLYVLLGLSIHGVSPIPYGSLVSHWFDRRRGLALGLTMLGIGVGAVIMPSVAQTLIARFGWKTAYSILGAAVLLICWPVLVYFLKDKPEDFGLLSRGASAKTSGIADVRQGLTAHETWRSRDFWLMAIAFPLVSASVQGCVVHIVPMLKTGTWARRQQLWAARLLGQR